MDKPNEVDGQQVSNEEQQKFYMLAIEAYKRQDWDAAETYYSRAIEAAPRNAKMYLYRGGVRCAKTQSILARKEYLTALEQVVSDYRKAYELTPDDPEVGLALTETEIVKGAVDAAALHSIELFNRFNEPVWKGLCSWMGCVACTLAATPEAEWEELSRYLPLAVHSLDATGWNTGDISKYLKEYASNDVPRACVNKALEIHNKVVGRSRDIQAQNLQMEKEETPLRNLICEAAEILAHGKEPVSMQMIKEIENEFVSLEQSRNEASEDLAPIRQEFLKLLIQQGTILATQAEHSKEKPKEERRALYLMSLDYFSSAARAALGDTQVNKTAVESFRKCAAFLITEMHDPEQAIQVLEQGCSLFSEDSSLKDLLELAKKLTK
jgi:tetratricopeptide (TPR) repeat protein